MTTATILQKRNGKLRKVNYISTCIARGGTVRIRTSHEKADGGGPGAGTASNHPRLHKSARGVGASPSRHAYLKPSDRLCSAEPAAYRRLHAGGAFEPSPPKARDAGEHVHPSPDPYGTNNVFLLSLLSLQSRRFRVIPTKHNCPHRENAEALRVW